MSEHNASQQIPTDGGSTPPRNAPSQTDSFNPNSGPINPDPVGSGPTTPGQAEGSANPDQQSETSPAPSQSQPAEG
jgi:hypothetical protein